jgi:nicotinamide riboside transporter PnuC
MPSAVTLFMSARELKMLYWQWPQNGSHNKTVDGRVESHPRSSGRTVLLC